MSSVSSDLLHASVRLVRSLEGFLPGGEAAITYNPLEYAWEGWKTYVERFADDTREILFLGMNPGPWGMAQTGVPFGEISAVRDWMGIDVPIGKPRTEHPKRPVEGFACARSEVSGRRFWGLMADRFGPASTYFSTNLALNYCPLVFMAESSRNITPDHLPAPAREELFARCDEHLVAQIRVLKPTHLVGIGAFAARRLAAVSSSIGGPEPLQILHPSPASPAANRGWAQAVTESMVRFGLWKDLR